MTDAVPTFSEIGGLIRRTRKAMGLSSLDQLANKIHEIGCERPSIAKLSRIETGEQPVPLDILPALSTLIGIPRGDLRPDLAASLREPAE